MEKSITTNEKWYNLPDREKFMVLFDAFHIPIRIWGKYIYAAGRRYRFDMKTGDLTEVIEFDKSSSIGNPV